MQTLHHISTSNSQTQYLLIIIIKNTNTVKSVLWSTCRPEMIGELASWQVRTDCFNKKCSEEGQKQKLDTYPFRTDHFNKKCVEDGQKQTGCMPSLTDGH
jgi:hypothetical protein